MKFMIVLVALVAFAAAEVVVGPNVRTTITGPDGSQIIKDDFSGSVLNTPLVYRKLALPFVRYAPYPYASSIYPSYYRYLL